MSITQILNNGLDRKQLDHSFDAGGTAQVFANELGRRISQSAGIAEGGRISPEEAGQAEQSAADKQGQLQKLEASIKSSVDFMVEKHGEKAGTAMMGIMLKRLGEGEITEENLGEAFLDVIRFVDKNFGIDSGDALMEHLNGNLNDSLNDFFDNGFSEHFFAVTSVQPSPAQSLDSGQSAKQLAEQYTDAVLQIIKDGRGSPEGAADEPYAQPADKNALLGVLYDEQV